MNPDGSPDINEMTEAAKAATGFLAEIRQWAALTPEDAEDRLQSRRTKRFLRDIKLIQKNARELGLDNELIDEMIADSAKRHQFQFNYERSIVFAAPLTSNYDNARNMDPEWVDNHRDHAKKAYDEETQRMWGQILAGEINAPGSYSKKAMSILGDMEQNDAAIFKKLCGRCIGGTLGNGNSEDPIPIFTENGDRFALTEDEKSSLNSAGLTNFGTHGISRQNTIPAKNGVVIAISGVDLYVQGDQGSSVSFPIHVFTKYGIELSKLCNLGSENGFKEYLAEKLLTEGLTVGKISKWIDKNNFTYETVWNWN